MKVAVSFFLSVAALAWSGPCSALVVSNVSVVDTANGSVGTPVDVRIDGNRIVEIGAAGSLQDATGRKIDGTEQFLIPGLWDMHVHVNDPPAAERWMLPMFIANGVTGVRDLIGDCWSKDCPQNLKQMRQLQARLDRGEIPGPRLVSIAGPIVHGPKAIEAGAPPESAPRTAAEGRRLARLVKARGADFLKPYDTLPRAAYFAMMDEAKKIGLPVSGHVPLSVSTMEAIDAGQATIEHAKHPLVDCSRYSRAFHDIFAAWSAGESRKTFRGFVKQGSGDESIGSYYPFILATFDESLCRGVIAGMAASSAYYTPTLITRRFEARADEPDFVADPRLALVPETIRKDWDRDAGNYRERFKSELEKRSYVDFYELGVKLTGQAHAAGVRILVGTDASDSFCFPGSGLHDEMLELQRAGLSNAAVLRAATLTAAEFMGATDRFGTVAVGKTADLVLLAANPLEDIGNARKVTAVVRDGKLFDRGALDALQAEVARYAQGQR